jgi:hypothetical protein
MLDDIAIDKSKLTFGYSNTITVYLYAGSWNSVERVPTEEDCRISISADGAYTNLVECTLKPEEQITIKHMVDYWIYRHITSVKNTWIYSFIGTKEALMSNFPGIENVLDLEKLAPAPSNRRAGYVQISCIRDLAAIVSQRFARKYKKTVYDYIMAKYLEHTMANV